MASADRRTTAGKSLFAAPEMLRYFAELDELLTQSGVVEQLHLHIAGGAVIATKSDSRLTADVDVISDEFPYGRSTPSAVVTPLLGHRGDSRSVGTDRLHALARDPLMIDSPPQTKGVAPDANSFDDRLYLRVALVPAGD